MIRIIGAYQVPFNDELYQEAYSLKYYNVSIPFWKKGKIKKQLIEELSSIALIEIEVNNSDGNFDINQIRQKGSDQAPYDEVYLDENGEKIIAEFPDIPDIPIFRVAFFLHFFNPNLPLITQYGEIVCPELIAIPERIDKLHKYEPVG